MDTHAGLFLDVVPEWVANRLLRVIYPDIIIRHILQHRVNTPMLKIVEFGLSKIKKMDDFRNT